MNSLNLMETFKDICKIESEVMLLDLQNTIEGISLTDKDIAINIISGWKDEIKKLILNNQTCENCKHFKEEKQPDGILSQECFYNCQCSVLYDNYWESK